VLIFDTLKKYLDLMSKGGAREFFNLLRALTIRGATILLLGHTNKNVGPDGRLVFEGVGDVRNDVDELFYLESAKAHDGTLTITVAPDKSRCAVHKRTFQLNPFTRAVTVLDRVVDIAEQQRQAEQRAKDAPVIEAIRVALNLRTTPMTLTEVVKIVREAGHGDNAIRRVVHAYTGDLWQATRGEHNALLLAHQTDRPL